jgi:hypothetical protein
MNPLSGLIAPLLALLPAGVSAPEAPPPPVAMEERTGLLPGAVPQPGEPVFERFDDLARAARAAAAANQVRIEQRITIRIAPAPPVHDPREMRRSLFDIPTRGFPRIEERRMNQCVAVGAIAGVQPDGPSRLMLFLRDQRLVSVALDKTCNARDFYSGFLVERTADGMICAGRDKLHSRSGTHCDLGKLRQMVEVDDGE